MLQRRTPVCVRVARTGRRAGRPGKMREASVRPAPVLIGWVAVISAAATASVTAAAREFPGRAESALVRSEEDIKIVTHPEPARTKGWAWKQPPDMVRPESGRRSHVFYVGEPVRFKLGGAAATYEVRDYRGDLVDRGAAGTPGAAGESVTLGVKTPGWYKLYVFGRETRPQWGDAVGDTTFVIFRDDPNFPPLPARDVPGGFYPSEDEPMRGVTGMGPQRHALREPEKPDEMIRLLQRNVDLDRKYYLPFDPVRKRVLMTAFPNGTRGKLDGVRKIVAHFKDDVRYWEPRNEPNYGSSGADFVDNEMKGFYEAVKSVDRRLRVMGPGTVSIGPNPHGLHWVEDFFRAGGARYIDAFSFHIYNGVNGDIWLARWTLDALAAVLAKYGVKDIEKWQTEQGFFAAVYGAYQPRLQGRWTMLEMMVFEQYGIPKEHNHLWYDRSHGFWDFPTWWENDGGGLNPAAPLMRVWSEELYGTNFARRLDFGKDGNKLYVGCMFEGPQKRVAAIMNVGCGRGRVELEVTRGEKLRVVSPFGVASDVPVRGGRARLEVPELPVYVELARGQAIEVLPQDWGRNLAREPGVTFASSGTAPNVEKIANGSYENWYYRQKPGEEPWADNTGSFPAWVELRLPEPRKVSRVVVFSAPPWQNQSTLVHYELKVDRGGRWATVAHVNEPLKTFGVYSCVTRTTVDSFFADRWVFEHEVPPVTTRKIRLLVRNATWGGGATKIVGEAGGQTGEHRFMLREFEIYGPEPPAVVRATVASPYVTGARSKTPVTVTVTNKTDAPASLTAKVTAPEGWKAVPARLRLSMDAREAKAATVEVVPQGDVPAGKVPLRVELVDARGRAVDGDEVTLEVFAPVDLVPQAPAELDKAKQALTVTATNVTGKPVTGALRLRISELVTGKGRTFSQERRLSLEPYEPTLLRFTVPGLDLAGSAWHVEYTFAAPAAVTAGLQSGANAPGNRMIASASRTYALRGWMAIGPFPNEFDREFGPEKGVDFAKRCTARDGKQVAWKGITSDTGGFVDLTKAFQPNQHVCAYVVGYVKCPTARKAVLSAGSDDGIKCWLNGKLVIKNNVARGAAPGQGKVGVELAGGWNEVMLKITQGVGGWGFHLDFLGPDGKPIRDITYSPKR